MEPASFAVGLLGLAGLSSSLLEAIDRAQTYRSFTRDTSVLDVLFDAEKVRLENWGRAVGFVEGNPPNDHHPALDGAGSCNVALKVFRFAKEICDDEDVRKSKSLRAGPADTRAGSSQSPDAPGESKLRKLGWALGGGSKRRNQVVLLKTLVESLHQLVPLDAVQGARALQPVDTLGLETGPSPADDLLTEIRKLISWLEVKTRQDMHAWLRHVPDEGYRFALEKRLEGTCSWILQQPTFLEWISPDFPSGAKLLWINGPAGFGKTILCANIVEHITRTLPTPIGHFFFSSDLDCRDKPTVALRSWLSQMATQHEGVLQCIFQRWESTAGIEPAATEKTIESLFKDVVRLVNGGTIVVDGLDECTHLEGQDSVARFLETLTTATAGTHTRVLVVSRSLSTIQHALGNNDRSLVSELRIRFIDVASDIAAYSRHTVDRQLPKSHDDIRSTLSEAMAKRCEGQFLWLQLQGKWLRSSMSKKQLQKAVEDTSAELDHIYDRSWNRITQLREAEKQRVFALLRWTAFALRPLTTCEIAEAVIIEDAEELWLEDLPHDVNEDYVDGEIVHLCSTLLEVRGGPSAPMLSQHTVHLPHFTVREYLLRNLPVPDYLRSNTSLAELQHTLLAKACLQYIQYRSVWQIAPLGSLVPLGASFRSYAATSWHRHVNLGQRGNDEITRLATEFLIESSPARDAWRSFIEIDDVDQHRWPTETSPPGPLHNSAKLQLMEVAMALIEGQSCDVNETTSFGRSALNIACSNGDVAFAAMLLNKGANPSLADKDGLVPIHVAAQNGHAEVVRLLLKSPTRTSEVTNKTWVQTDPTKQSMAADVYDVSFKTPLHYSVLHDQTRCVQLLLDHGARLTSDINNMTPLHYAVLKTSEEMAQCFLVAGVPIDGRVKRHDWRPEHREGRMHYTRSDDGRSDPGLEIDSRTGLTALHYAALIGCQRMTKFLLDHGADPNTVSEHGETPLHLALKRDIHGPKWPGFVDHWNDPIHRIEDSLDIIGFDPEDFALYSELETCIEADRTAVLNLLLDHGSTDANSKDIYGASPLHNVLYENSTAPEIIGRLIKKGADLSARNHHGQTPLHLACSKGNKEAVATILHHGADITISDFEGLDALHYAAQSGDTETILHLFACVGGVDHVGFATSQDQCGRNALHHLLRRPEVVKYAAVQLLLDNDVNVNDLDDAGLSPLALYLGNRFILFDDAPPIVELILNRAADPLFKTPDGGLGLAHLYAKSCRVNAKLLTVLADRGVDLQAGDDDGRTVLHHCAIAGSLTEEAFQYLCSDARLVKKPRDAHGKTPQQYATEMRKKGRHPDVFDRDRWSRTENILLGLI